ncbi:MAG: SGNH/GDSL hydrolase family protein [Niabella sp.]
MKHICFLLMFCLAAGASFAQQKNDWANFAKYAKANDTAAQGAVVFMGNSITQGWVTAHPAFFAENNYIGRGISGQVTSQMLVRFRPDVISLKPKAVVILAGTNDIAQNNGYISNENILNNIISMCELAKVNNIRPILCSVLPAYQFGWRKELTPDNDIIKLNEMIKAYATENKIVYVDYHSALKDERNGLPEKYAKDGVHPTIEGYAVMEKLIQEAIGSKKERKKLKNRQYLFSKE